ncbi:hypothetical protein BC829DRAFT_399826 [Chytridium lagenaria]|nr:hypothetical protein BC829DRAFT_399826 [Chytridium lagenaria]
MDRLRALNPTAFLTTSSSSSSSSSASCPACICTCSTLTPSPSTTSPTSTNDLSSPLNNVLPSFSSPSPSPASWRSSIMQLHEPQCSLSTHQHPVRISIKKRPKTLPASLPSRSSNSSQSAKSRLYRHTLPATSSIVAAPNSDLDIDTLLFLSSSPLPVIQTALARRKVSLVLPESDASSMDASDRKEEQEEQDPLDVSSLTEGKSAHVPSLLPSDRLPPPPPKGNAPTCPLPPTPKPTTAIPIHVSYPASFQLARRRSSTSLPPVHNGPSGPLPPSSLRPSFPNSPSAPSTTAPFVPGHRRRLSKSLIRSPESPPPTPPPSRPLPPPPTPSAIPILRCCWRRHLPIQPFGPTCFLFAPTRGNFYFPVSKKRHGMMVTTVPGVKSTARLPGELWTQILSNLHIIDLIKVKHVSTLFSEITEELLEVKPEFEVYLESRRLFRSIHVDTLTSSTDAIARVLLNSDHQTMLSILSLLYSESLSAPHRLTPFLASAFPRIADACRRRLRRRQLHMSPSPDDCDISSPSTSPSPTPSDPLTPSSITLTIRSAVAGRALSDLTQRLTMLPTSHPHTIRLARLVGEFYRTGWIADRSALELVRTLVHLLGVKKVVGASDIVKCLWEVLVVAGRDLEKAAPAVWGGVYRRIARVVEVCGGVGGDEPKEEEDEEVECSREMLSALDVAALQRLLALRRNKWIMSRDSGFEPEPASIVLPGEVDNVAVAAE